MRSSGVCREKYARYRQLMGAFDWEYEGFLGKDIEGLYIDPYGERCFFTDQRAALARIIDVPRDEKGKQQSIIVWAHAGENAEFPRMAEAFCDMARSLGGEGMAVVSQGDQKYIAVIIRLPRSGGGTYRVTIADSYALVPTSLEKMSEALAPSFTKHGHCPDHDFTNGGPWWNPECDVCRDYLIGDVEALWHSMHNLQSLLLSAFGIPIGITCGSIAMKYWKTTIPEGMTFFRLSPDKEKWLTEPGMTAIHGGLVWPGHRRGNVGPAETYDRSGAYAHQLRQGVPSGLASWTTVFRDDIPGVYEVIAHVPEDVNIPVVTRSGDGPLYPWGTFRARITSETIKYAAKLGCTFDVRRGIVWPKLEYPFQEFVDKLESIEYPEQGTCSKAMKLIVKLMRNSLIGKFASKPVIEKPYIGEEAGEGGIPYIDPATGVPLPVWHRPEEIEQASYVLPHWNIWLTANQRIDLHRALDALGPDALYGDTDSITAVCGTASRLISQGIIDVGNGYGKYHEEGLWHELFVIGPKSKCGWTWNASHWEQKPPYEAQDEDGDIAWVYPPPAWVEGKWSWSSTAKGITRKQRLACPDRQCAAAYGIEAEPVTWESSLSFRARLLAPASGYGVVRTRKFSRLENSISWVVDQDNNIRPVHIEEELAMTAFPPCSRCGGPSYGYTFSHPAYQGHGIYGVFCPACTPEFKDKRYLLRVLREKAHPRSIGLPDITVLYLRYDC